MDRADCAGTQHNRGRDRACHASRQDRNTTTSSLGTCGHRRRLGDAVPRLCLVADRAHLGVRRYPDRASRGGRAMIVVLLNTYLVILFILVKTKIVPFNLFWKVSPLLVLILLGVGLFIPMNWGAPQGAAVVVRHSVAIVPDVAGEVTEVPVEPNKPLKAGDVLFRIDAAPYEAQVRALEAQLKLQQTRLAQMTQLQTTGSGRAFDVEQRQSEFDHLQAQLDGAKWN